MTKTGGAKRCARRRQAKPRAAFASNRSLEDGAPSCCRERPGSRGRNRTASGALPTARGEYPKAGGRTGRPLRGYGLTEAECNAVTEARGGVRAVRLSWPPEDVDHCHRTGRVRGVPCSGREPVIGKYRDDPDVARRAAAYLEGNSWKPTLPAQGVCRLPS
ncbi:recombination endonuclease VII [Streptomyces sp. MUM 203J]|uniref:endonuclease domain-containing protein n=1 Tax=Streptomyces sp. MUM 203J TaxID=2791990 RepID=UPI0027E4292F|nr:endonuclease domain-containing protein [Streptomyces sp. MUM 203J]MCH0539450.1 recombination endonuclease VII [Streptomyces sp. MUM 203J]